MAIKKIGGNIPNPHDPLDLDNPAVKKPEQTGLTHAEVQESKETSDSNPSTAHDNLSTVHQGIHVQDTQSLNEAFAAGGAITTNAELHAMETGEEGVNVGVPILNEESAATEGAAEEAGLAVSAGASTATEANRTVGGDTATQNEFASGPTVESRTQITSQGKTGLIAENAAKDQAAAASQASAESELNEAAETNTTATSETTTRFTPTTPTQSTVVSGEVESESDIATTQSTAESDSHTPLTSESDVASISENDTTNPVIGNVLDNDTGDSLAVTAVNGSNSTTISGQYGSLNWNSDGSYHYNLDNTLHAVQAVGIGETLTDTFTYTISDGLGGTISNTLTITVTGTNDTPVVQADIAGTTENAAITIDVLHNDTDIDTNDVLTITDANISAVNSGSIAIVDNKLEFTPGNDFDHLAVGETTQVVVSYTISDGHGGTSNSTATITITGTNDVPVIGGVSTGAVTEEAAATLTATGALTIADVDSGESNFAAQTIAGSGHFGELVLAADGTWTYTADNSQTALQQLSAGSSLTDSFVVYSSDGSTSQTITITINGTNDVPVIGGVSTGAVTEEDGSVLTASGALTIADVDTGESNFAAQTIAGAGHFGELVLAADGSWTYTADNSQTAMQELGAGSSITDSFVVHSSDGSASQTITITINGTNDVPVIGGVSTGAVTEEDGSVLTASGALTIEDVDSGESNFAAQTIAGAGHFGTLALAADGTWTYTADNSQTAVQELGAGSSITDSFVVHSSDGSASQTITITINGTNDVPVIGGTSTAAVTEDSSLTGGNLTAGGTLTITDVDSGQASFTAQSGIAGSNGYGTFGISSTGVWTYVANNSQSTIQQLAAGNSVTDSFVVHSADGTAQTIVVTISGEADAPTVTVSNPTAVSEDTTDIPLNVGVNFIDAGTTNSIVISGIPTGATLSDDSGHSFTGGSSTDVTGWNLATLKVTPPANSATDFTLTVTATAIEPSGPAQVTTRNLTVAINAVADAPTLTAPAMIYGNESTAIALGAVAALADIDASESLAIIVSGLPTGATLSTGTDLGDGSYSLTAAQLSSASITAPPAAGNDFDITITATSTESENSDQASTTNIITVAIDNDYDSTTLAKATVGGSDDNVMTGKGGADVIEGQAGADTISGGGGADKIYGGSDNDILKGDTNDDTLFGGSGDDTLYGASGSNLISDGASEADVLHGGSGNDMIYGEGGADTLYGESGNDMLRGGDDNDILYGGSGNDTLYGDAGADTLYGGAGSNVMQGGAGNDLFIYDTPTGHGAGTTDTIAGGAGGVAGGWTDTIQLEGVGVAPNAGGANDWTVSVSTPDITANIDAANQAVTFKNSSGATVTDVSGSITMHDGSVINFSEIEEIKWT